MKKRVLIICLSVLVAICLAVAIPFMVTAIKTNNMKRDYSYLLNDEIYAEKVEINDIELVTQHISCGYATIEMMSSFYGNKVTEDDLSEKHNGKIVTSSSNGFSKEINDVINNKTFVRKRYLKDDELLKQVHNALSKGNPVAIEWAALYEGVWTLHFSVVSGMDLSNDDITIYNPYGEIEHITTEEFLNRTSFNAYEHMPLFLKFGFAFGAFHKNTIFYAE